MRVWVAVAVVGLVLMLVHSRGGEWLLERLLPARGAEGWHWVGMALLALGVLGMVVASLVG